MLPSRPPVLALLLAVLVAPPVVAAEPLALSLDEIRERVAEDNELGGIVRSRIEQSRARRRQALAQMLPQLSVAASGSWVDEEVSFGSSTVVNQLDWDASGEASVTLFDGTMYPLYRQRGEEIEVAEAEAEWQRILLDLEAEEGFHTLAAAVREVAIAEDMLELRREHADEAEALADAGVALSLDVSRAEAELLAAEQQLLEARKTRDNASDALAVLMGLDPGTPIELKPLRAWGPIVDPDREDLRRRADFMGMAFDLEAMQDSRASAAWSLAPKLDLRTRLSFGPTSFSNPDGRVLTATLTATWTLYDGGWRYAEMDRIDASLRERRLSLQRELRRAEAELHRILREFVSARETEDVAERRVEVAREAYEMATARFERGIATSFEVRDAAEALEEARMSESQASLQKMLLVARYHHLRNVEEAP
ncbi:MAG: TolC family protein [Myxococcota bacterium]